MRLPKAVRRRVVSSILVIAAMGISGEAIAALQAHISIKGKKQGQFKGEGPVGDKRRDRWMPVVSFSFGVQSPRDAASGLPTGKRRYEPLCFVKEWGAATPQILTALSTNESLSEVVFEFTRSSGSDDVVFQRVTLTDATVSQVREYTAGAAAADGAATSKHSLAADTGTLDDVCFTFRKIAIDNLDGKTTFMDDWSAAL